MTEKQLKLNMDMIFAKCLKTHDIKTAIAEAVTLGMNYREQEIKSGINIVFDTIHRQEIKCEQNDEVTE